MTDGPAAPPAAPPHSLFDDVQGLLTGTLLAALGIVLFRHAGMVTGGLVGVAFVAHYATGLPVGALLFAINLPFYWLAWRRLGARFTMKTLVTVTLLSFAVELIPRWLVIGALDPLFAVIAGGLLVGVGLVILFRHRASLGGLSVLVLWLQERFGWRAGHVQLAIDLAILLCAWPLVDASRLALSVVGAAALNLALAANHRAGRYTAF